MHRAFVSSGSQAMLEQLVKKRNGPRVPLGFRIEPKLKEALEKAAEQDERSVSSLVHQILSKAMRERKLLK
jgi:hypothetical protein